LVKMKTSINRARLFTGLLVVSIAALVISITLMASVPPVSRDALVHHLAVPKLYLKNGGIYEIPEMFFSYYPMNLQLLYMGALYFGSDIVPKFIHFGFALLTAWLIFRYLRQRINRFYGLLGALFFLSVPLIVKLSITVYVDLGLIFFSTASLLLLLEWVEKGLRIRFLALSAIMCGLAMGTKYNGLVTFLLLTLSVPFLYSRYRRDRGAVSLKAIKYCTVYSLIALLLFSPWMIRNYHWKRNPIYPLYDKWFNRPPHTEVLDKDMEDEEEARGIFTYRGVIYGEKWWEMALLPLRIFFQGRDGDPRRFDGKLNPFLLFFPVLAFFGARDEAPAVRREKAFLLAFSCLFFFLAFFSFDLRMRYISPIIPPLVILSMFGTRNLFRALGRMENPMRRNTGIMIAGAALVVSFLLNALYIADEFKHVSPLKYLRGELNRDEYIAKYRPEYPAVQYINAHLPEDALVYFLFLGNRGYYSDRRYLLGEGFFAKAVREAKDPEAILMRLQERGITHLLLCDPIFQKWALGKFTSQERETLNGFLVRFTRVLFAAKGFVLLSIQGELG